MITEKMVRDTLKMMMRETSEELRERNERMRFWLEMQLREEIASLSLLDPDFYGSFVGLTQLCEDFGVDFWKLVEDVGGMHATRLLIHSVMMVTRRVADAPRIFKAAY